MAEDVAAQLRHKHVRTLEVLQTVMDENASLKKTVKQLQVGHLEQADVIHALKPRYQSSDPASPCSLSLVRQTVA